MGSGELAAFFDTAQVTPVLTAHPTEVQRKSILNCQMAIARLLDERDRMQLTPKSARPTTRPCAARCSPCGRPACCAPKSCR
jgi:phosphoenolpyruvate carboxylase